MLVEKLKYYHIYRWYNEDGIAFSINRIFQKYGIKREAYHGVQINDVCVRWFMAETEEIMHAIFIFLKGSSRGYGTNENIE